MALTGTETVAVTVSFLLLATIVLLLRCDIRYRILKNHGAEDILVICAWVFAVPEAMLICLSAGHHESAYPQVIPYLKMFFWTMFLHNFTLTCSKLSLLVQFLRFFQEGKTAKACWCGIVVVAINAIMQFLLNIFHCYPVSTFWEKQLVSDHRRACLDYATLFYPGSIGNVITSLMVFIIPMPKIWSLPLQRKAKVSLFLIFGFGFLDIILSIVRLILIGVSIPVLKTRSGTWSSLESMIAIICASAGALRPFLSQSLPRFLSAMRHGRSRSQDDALGTAAAEGTCMEKGFDGTSLTSAEGEGKEVEMRARSSTLVRVRLVLDDGGKMI